MEKYVIMQYKNELSNPNLVSDLFEQCEKEMLYETQLLGHIKRYIRKNQGCARKYTLEEAIVILLAFAKFETVETMCEIMQEQFCSRVLVDAIERLKKKGFVEILLEKENNKAFIRLTAKGKSYYEENVGTKIVPYAEKNFNNAGHVFHDYIAGHVFMEILKTDIPFAFTRKFYEDWEDNDLAVISDSKCVLFHNSVKGNKRIFYVEADTGTENPEQLFSKIGRYYDEIANYRMEVGNIAYVHSIPMEKYISDQFPMLFTSHGKYIQEVINVLKLCKYDLYTLRNELQNDTARIATVLKTEGEKVHISVTNLRKVVNSIIKLFEMPAFRDLLLPFENDIDRLTNLYRRISKTEYGNKIIWRLKTIYEVSKTKKRINRILKKLFYKEYKQTESVILGVTAMCRGWDVFFVPLRQVGILMGNKTPYNERSTIKTIQDKYFRLIGQYEKLEDMTVEKRYFQMINAYDRLVLKNGLFYIAQKNNGTINELYIEDISMSISARMRVIILANKWAEREQRAITVVCTIACIQDAIDMLTLFDTQRYSSEDEFFSILFILYHEIDDGTFFKIERNEKDEYVIIKVSLNQE